MALRSRQAVQVYKYLLYQICMCCYSHTYVYLLILLKYFQFYQWLSFFSARQCFGGFKRVAGGIPGNGQLKGNVDTDEIGCAYLCQNDQTCCSYEHSPTMNLCNLHKDCKSKGKNKDDYKLCVKGKKLEANQTTTRLSCFYVTALLSWDWNWGWFECEVEVRLNWGWD